jgi:hypothetical protein
LESNNLTINAIRIAGSGMSKASTEALQRLKREYIMICYN